MRTFLTTRELEKKTTPISYERAMELINSAEYVKVQETPKNIFTTYSIRLDEVNGGVFIWSGGMQRYFLIAKKAN